ncbi:related to neutral amino acid permease [Phialocephala subalpina]|uniref:Related to neutral amino acid permease n=1 Tax=Phialocephala subalpina TaxID=576137 RepID=A0A1L7XWJ7_9HELO|nr:related to neutral amino acid permease [Phialocephala subalpina]
MESPTKKESNNDISAIPPCDIGVGTAKLEENEVFATGEGGVNFRNVGWMKAAIFFTKMTFATGVLSVPSVLYQLGAVAGGIFIAFWDAVNTCEQLQVPVMVAFVDMDIDGAKLQCEFKILHPSVHTVSDMSYLCIGLAVLALSTALSAISHHGTCTVRFSFIAYLIITIVGSIRAIERLGWILWIGFASIVTAVMIVVIAVTVPDRPAAAPRTGSFELGFGSLPPQGTSFATAWAASIAIYASSANTSGYIPVISEMRRPQDYFKALYACMTWITASYLALALTIYAYCGKWIASPALGSAGPTIKIIAYAVANPGLIAGGVICIHISGKVVFVRILRNTHHLTSNTKTHWEIWLASTLGTGLLGWLCAEAILFLTSLYASGYYKGGFWMKAQVGGHLALLLLGIFTTVAGTYANIQNIVDQYKAGDAGSAFTCTDNSGSVPCKSREI